MPRALFRVPPVSIPSFSERIIGIIGMNVRGCNRAFAFASPYFLHSTNRMARAGTDIEERVLSLFGREPPHSSASFDTPPTPTRLRHRLSAMPPQSLLRSLPAPLRPCAKSRLRPGLYSHSGITSSARIRPFLLTLAIRCSQGEPFSDARGPLECRRWWL